MVPAEVQPSEDILQEAPLHLVCQEEVDVLEGAAALSPGIS